MLSSPTFKVQKDTVESQVISSLNSNRQLELSQRTMNLTENLRVIANSQANSSDYNGNFAHLSQPQFVAQGHSLIANNMSQLKMAAQQSNSTQDKQASPLPLVMYDQVMSSVLDTSDPNTKARTSLKGEASPQMPKEPEAIQTEPINTELKNTTTNTSQNVLEVKNPVHSRLVDQAADDKNLETRILKSEISTHHEERLNADKQKDMQIEDQDHEQEHDQKGQTKLNPSQTEQSQQELRFRRKRNREEFNLTTNFLTGRSGDLENDGYRRDMMLQPSFHIIRRNLKQAQSRTLQTKNHIGQNISINQQSYKLNATAQQAPFMTGFKTTSRDFQRISGAFRTSSQLNHDNRASNQKKLPPWMEQSDYFSHEPSQKRVVVKVMNKTNNTDRDSNFQHFNTSRLNQTISPKDMSRSFQLNPEDKAILSAMNKKHENQSQNITDRVGRVDRLFANYAGADKLKESFAQMLYSNQANVDITDDMKHKKPVETRLNMKKQAYEEETFKRDHPESVQGSLDLFTIKSNLKQINAARSNFNKTFQTLQPIGDSFTTSNNKLGTSDTGFNRTQLTANDQDSQCEIGSQPSLERQPPQLRDGKLTMDQMVKLKLQESKVTPFLAVSRQTLLLNQNAQKQKELQNLGNQPQINIIKRLHLDHMDTDMMEKSVMHSLDHQNVPTSPKNLETVKLDSPTARSGTDGATVTFNEHASLSSGEEDYVITEAVDENGLNLDMSQISILKAHITNSEIYQLSQKGFTKQYTKQQLKKTQRVKELEQLRRYHRLRGTEQGEAGPKSVKLSPIAKPQKKRDLARSVNVGALAARKMVREESLRRKQFTVQSKEWTIKGTQEAASEDKPSPLNLTKQSSPKPWETDKTMQKVLKKYAIPTSAEVQEERSLLGIDDIMELQNLAAVKEISMFEHALNKKAVDPRALTQTNFGSGFTTGQPELGHKSSLNTEEQYDRFNQTLRHQKGSVLQSLLEDARQQTMAEALSITQHHSLMSEPRRKFIQRQSMAQSINEKIYERKSVTKDSQPTSLTIQSKGLDSVDMKINQYPDEHMNEDLHHAGGIVEQHSNGERNLSQSSIQSPSHVRVRVSSRLKDAKYPRGSKQTSLCSPHSSTQAVPQRLISKSPPHREQLANAAGKTVSKIVYANIHTGSPISTFGQNMGNLANGLVGNQIQNRMHFNAIDKMEQTLQSSIRAESTNRSQKSSLTKGRSSNYGGSRQSDIKPLSNRFQHSIVLPRRITYAETLENQFQKGCNQIAALDSLRNDEEEEDSYNQNEYQALKAHQFNLPKGGQSMPKRNTSQGKPMKTMGKERSGKVIPIVEYNSLVDESSSPRLRMPGQPTKIVVQPKKVKYDNVIYENAKQSKHRKNSPRQEGQRALPPQTGEQGEPRLKQYVIRFDNSGPPGVEQLKDNKSANTDELQSVGSIGKINLNSINGPGKSKFNSTQRHSLLESHNKYFTQKTSSFHAQKVPDTKAHLANYYDQFSPGKTRKHIAGKKATSPIRLQMNSRSVSGTETGKQQILHTAQINKGRGTFDPEDEHDHKETSIDEQGPGHQQNLVLISSGKGDLSTPEKPRNSTPEKTPQELEMSQQHSHNTGHFEGESKHSMGGIGTEQMPTQRSLLTGNMDITKEKSIGVEDQAIM